MSRLHLSLAASTQHSTIPSYEYLLNRIPPEQNPYEVIMQLVDGWVFPVVPKFTYVLLVIFGASNIITIIACLAVVFIPLRRRGHARDKHVWWFRTHHVDSSVSPFYIPNAGLAVAITQALANFMFLIYTVLSYFSFKDRKVMRWSYIYVWYDVCWLPGYIGFYLTAVSALYAWLCSPIQTHTRRTLCQPLILNTIFALIPILVTLSCFSFAILIVNRMNTFFAAYDQLEVCYRAASDAWEQQEANSKSSSMPYHLLNSLLSPAEAFELMRSETDILIKILKYSSISWIVAGLFLASFYAIAVIAFVKVIRSSFKIVKSGRIGTGELPTENDFERSKRACKIKKKRFPVVGWWRNTESASHELCPVDLPLQQPRTEPSQNQIELEKGYRYLVRHCTLMLIGLLFDVGVGFQLMLSADELSNPTYRCINALLCCLDVIVITPAMLFRTWRILTEKDVTESHVSDEISTRVL